MPPRIHPALLQLPQRASLTDQPYKSFPHLPCTGKKSWSLTLDREQERLFESVSDPAEKACSIGAVDEPVIVGKRQRQDQPWLKRTIDPFRLHARTRQTKNRDFRMIYDRTEPRSSDSAQVRNGEGPAFHLFRCQLPLARLLGKLGHLRRELDDILLVNIAQHGHQQAPLRIHGHAQVHILLVNDLAALHIDAGIELGKDL